MIPHNHRWRTTSALQHQEQKDARPRERKGIYNGI